MLALAGCSYVVEPGHRGILFKRSGGLRPGSLQPGYHWIGAWDRVDDFDTTYSQKHEEIHSVSSEGLRLDLQVSIIFRPVQSELYDLDVEIGTNYYDEVLGPEFRSATRGVFAHHSYVELLKNNEKIEDEIESDVRRRVHGKHIEVSSVTLEEVNYAPEIQQAVRAKLVGEQEAVRKKAQLEADALRMKLDLEHEAERDKLQAVKEIERKEKERRIAEEQAKIDRVQAETEAANELTKAKAEAESTRLLAAAHAEEKRAEAQHLTPLMVQMHAYDALSKLGGNGTQILLGDWSHVPSFLFPPFFRAVGGGGKPVASRASE
jgi:regulator of protease activity HflC (stomatin/prohibitin superfamily)